jgi:PAS domain S-box-containing protein
MNEPLNFSFDEALNNLTGIFFWQEDFDESGSQIQFSDNVLAVTGYTAEEIIGLGRGWLSMIVNDDLPGYRKKLDELKENNSEGECKLQYRIRKKNGGLITVSEKVFFNRDFEGIINKRFSMVSDITEFSSEIELLNNRIAELEQLNSAKDNFISILSHDLRAPFTSILGFSDVLLQESGLSDKEKTEYLRYINESSHTQLQLINYLLDWSRLQTGRLKLDLQRVHAQSIVYNCVSLLTGMAVRKNINIKVNIPDTLFINADERLLSQVLTNLISNAIKFSEEHDTVEINAGIFNDEFVEFVVKDEGVGISEINRDRLFNIGKLFSIEGTKGEKGTGMGLALARQIVEKHNGEIWFYTSEGEGSEFHFTVPASENTLLLVVNDKEERELYSKIIDEHFNSLKILYAQNAFEGMGIISARMPSLVIADHNLPLMDGLQFIHSVRKENKNIRIPFIILIDPQAEDLLKTYQESGVKTLKKASIHPELLKEKIELLLYYD